MKTQHDKNGNRVLVMRLVALSVVMFGFGAFALPPMYVAFCEITGFGGRTNASAVGAAPAVEQIDYARRVRVEFVTTVNEYAPWTFHADIDSMDVVPGKLHYAAFTATNLSGEAKVAQAIPSVAPIAAAEHFSKIECFCFENQAFAAGEERILPLQFIVAAELPPFVDTISLQYTFYDMPDADSMRIAANTAANAN